MKKSYKNNCSFPNRLYGSFVGSVKEMSLIDEAADITIQTTDRTRKQAESGNLTPVWQSLLNSDAMTDFKEARISSEDK